MIRMNPIYWLGVLVTMMMVMVAREIGLASEQLVEMMYGSSIALGFIYPVIFGSVTMYIAIHYAREFEENQKEQVRRVSEFTKEVAAEQQENKEESDG